jgi:hypothetical protein
MNRYDADDVLYWVNNSLWDLLFCCTQKRS